MHWLMLFAVLILAIVYWRAAIVAACILVGAVYLLMWQAERARIDREAAQNCPGIYCNTK